MRNLIRIFWIALIILTFVIAILAIDQESISLRFLNWNTVTISAFWWLLAALVSGVFLGFLLMLRPFLKQRGIARRLSNPMVSKDQEATRGSKGGDACCE